MGERWDLELTDVKDRVSDGRRRPQLNGVGRDVTGQSAAHEVSKSRDLRSVRRPDNCFTKQPDMSGKSFCKTA